jgi:hypothetical protein
VGDRAAATLSNHSTVQLRRIATGEWLIDKLGEDGLPASRPMSASRASAGLNAAAIRPDHTFRQLTAFDHRQ